MSIFTYAHQWCAPVVSVVVANKQCFVITFRWPDILRFDEAKNLLVATMNKKQSRKPRICVSAHGRDVAVALQRPQVASSRKIWRMQHGHCL